MLTNMEDFSNILNIYKNGNYIVKIFKDGTKERILIGSAEEFNAAFPENMDVKITDKCCQGCPFCYEGCKPEGLHAMLFDGDTPAFEWMKHLHAGTELAINGNDMDHPQLEQFLKYMKERGVLVNITVNQTQFETNFDKLYRLSNQELIRGTGVSLQHFTYGFDQMCKWFPNLVIHTIYGVTPIEEYMVMEGRNYNILILGYKMKNRGAGWIADRWHGNLFGNVLVSEFDEYLAGVLDDKRLFRTISFDNLALEQLNFKEDFFTGTEDEWDKLYQGDDGTHTFYLDLCKGEFAKSSTEETRYDIGNKTCEEMLKILKN